MTKADKLRAALRDAGNDGLNTAAIKKVLGGEGYITQFLVPEEIITHHDTDGKRYTLNPDYTPARERKAQSELPIKRVSKKKPAGKKTKPRKKTIRGLVFKFADRSETPNLQQLIAHNLREACAMLRTTVADEIENLDTNPRLTAALANAERAEVLAQAA